MVEVPTDELSLKQLRTTLTRVMKKARKHGLLSLREDLDGVSNQGLPRDLEMMVEGVPPDKILAAYRTDLGALSEAGDGAAKARGDQLCATAIGVVALQRGYRPRVVRKLLAGFGA